jgi:ATP-binding cassette subfamily B multidrug efflux pump
MLRFFAKALTLEQKATSQTAFETSMKSLFALNPYIWKYKKLVLLGLLFVVISNLFGVYPPQLVRAAIDLVRDLLSAYRLTRGFEAQGLLESMILNSLMIYAGMVIVAALLRGVFLFFTRQTLIVMSRKVEYDLRNSLFDHYQNLSLTFYRRNRTGDLMARITEDITRVRMYLGPGIMYTMNSISLAVIVLTMMLLVNWELTLWAILPLPILSFAVYYVTSMVTERSDKIQKQLSQLTAYTQEVFSGIRVVKAYVRELAIQSKMAEESEEYKERSMRLVRLNALFFPLIMLLVGASNALTVFIGGGKVIEGTMTLGNIAEFIMYINMLTWPIISIGWVSTLIQRAAASQARLNELTDEKSEIVFPESGPQPKAAQIVFDEVSYTYPHTGIQALKNVSFQLQPGQKLGILGPTGSGKSTLVNLLPRMLDPESGAVKLDGVDLKDYASEDLRTHIGYAPQDDFLFSETIKENVAFGLPGASQKQVEDAAKKAGIYDNIQGFPEQFETEVGERGVTLSGGQKQRLALARAWIRNPLLLVLDDSLSAVDTKTEELILNNLRQARQENPDMSVIMVSHRISTIQDSDLILVLEDGAVTQQGSHAELVAQDGYYSMIYNKQRLEMEYSE